jgi:hypothetical protein
MCALRDKVWLHADTYMTHSWPHITATCPVGNTTGLLTSAVCPPGKRVVRLAVDLAVPYKIFENRKMLVAHAGPLSNATLLPVVQNSVSSQAWGCDRKSIFT